MILVIFFLCVLAPGTCSSYQQRSHDIFTFQSRYETNIFNASMNFTSMERKSEHKFEADYDDSWKLLVEKVHCLIHPDILGSTPRLAHPDQRDHHLHLRLQVRHPAQRGYLRLGPADQVCPGKRRRNLWMPGNLFLIWFDLWGHPLQIIELYKILGAYC